MEINQKCIQCGATDKLLELDNGIFACKKCLDALGEEQREMQEYIEDYLAENFGINSPETQAKTLEAISISIKYKTGLLGEDEVEKINREKERMEKAFE